MLNKTASPATQESLNKRKINGNKNTCVIGANQTVHHPVSLLDLSPTPGALANAPVMPVQDGDSLLLLLKNPQGKNNWATRPIFSELEISDSPPIRMVRRGRWKYTYSHGLACSHFYNLDNDPDELHDLSEAPEHATIHQEFKALVFRGWNPVEIEHPFKSSMNNLRYMAQWGREVDTDSLPKES